MSELVLFGAIAFAGVAVQSFAGFAGSLVAIPLFSLFISPREAVPAYNLTMFAVNTYLVWEARRHIDVRRIGVMLAGGLVGVPIGANLLVHAPVHAIGLAISVVTLAFAVLFLLNVRIPLRENAPTQAGIGVLSGILGGSISESGPPIVIYSLAQGWEKDTFRTTLLAYFFGLSLISVTTFAVMGMYTPRVLTLGTGAIVPAALAGLLGVALKNRVGQSAFRKAILAIIVAVSILGFVKHSQPSAAHPPAPAQSR